MIVRYAVALQSAAEAKLVAKTAKDGAGKAPGDGKKAVTPQTRPGGTPAPDPKPPIDLGSITSPEPTSTEERFLRAAHQVACKHFGTVLGPEANDAHRNHFHVDLAPRKRQNYCR